MSRGDGTEPTGDATDPAVYAQVCEVFYELCELDEHERARQLERRELPEVVRVEVAALLEREAAGAELDDETLDGLGQELLEHHARAPGTDAAPLSVGTYQILRELGAGGMGVVYEARHTDSAHPCALKVLRPELGTGDVSGRFRREARILADLRHPGIAAFLDAGEAPARFPTATLDVPFLALELVEGEPLHRYADAHKLTLAQRLELVARVCDALQHAHEAGVVHRDLKPSNVLVATAGDGDPIGQPKVLDFGIAFVTDGVGSMSATRTGTWMGTLAYMSPEQAAGEVRDVDARSDVYSLGVVAFELVTGAMPYELRDCPLTEAARRICEELPSWRGLEPDVGPADVRLVLGKALEKSRARRYASATAFADDLRAAADGRGVQARAPGLARRVSRQVRRHPLLTSAGLLVAVTLGAVAFLWREAVVDRDVAERNRVAALDSARVADESARALARERDQVMRLADLAELRALVAGADALWPAHPERLALFDDWLTRADRVSARRDDGAAFLATLERADAAAQLGIAAFELDWRRETLRELIAALATFEAAGGPREQVTRARDAAATLGVRSIDAHRDAWDAARAAIQVSPHYAGLELEPQVGLIPLGADPRSGLWEFWHIETGDEPPRDPATGAIAMDAASGLVFVLIPGGSFAMGATVDPRGPNHDEWAKDRSTPVHPVTLAPFFISKFELTMSQWVRAGGTDRGTNPGGERADLPAGLVTWGDAVHQLRRLGLDLPTEARWEYAARGGVSAPAYWGHDTRDLVTHENVADAGALAAFPQGKWFHYEAWTDAHVFTAPVGSYAPNPFGLHDMLGNVHEWCLDVLDAGFYARSPVDEPLRDLEGDETNDACERVVRGGSYKKDSRWARSGYRVGLPPVGMQAWDVGVRPVRDL